MSASQRVWYDVEIAYLKRHATDKSLAELAHRLRTDVGAIEGKLKELRLVAAAAAARPEVDPLVLYQQGLKALYAGEWQAAIDAFEEVVREGYGDQAARARQFIATARERAAAAAAAAAPEAEDPWLRAVFEKNRGRLDEALALCAAEGRAETDERFAYLAAVLSVLRGDLEAGGRHLARAVDLDPRNRAHALHDPDLAPLRDQLGG